MNDDFFFQAKARRVHDKLRDAVISNVKKEYYRTGYLWEQYNDKTGQGQGCKPFTGWTSLVVLMMSEKYWILHLRSMVVNIAWTTSWKTISLWQYNMIHWYDWTILEGRVRQQRRVYIAQRA